MPSPVSVRRSMLLAMLVGHALLACAGQARAQLGPAPNEVVLFDGPNYTTLTPNGRRAVAPDPQGAEIQGIGTFAVPFAFRSIQVGSAVAAYVYAYDPTGTRRENSHHRTPILQSSPSTSGVAAMVVVGPRSAIGPLAADNPMRVVFEGRFTVTQAAPQGLERRAFPIRYGGWHLCEDTSAIADLEPHVLEVWSGSRPQSEVQLYLYGQPGCTGQGVHHAGAPGGIPLPPPGLGGPVRSFMALYTGPIPQIGPQAQMQQTPNEVVPPQNPVLPPEPAPGGWVAPFVDLAGRWQFGGTGEILDFALVPGTARFQATQPGIVATLITLPSGRVRLDVAANGQQHSTEGDLIVQGPPGLESYTLIFDLLPGDSRHVTLSRL